MSDQLQCDMEKDCSGTVTYIDNKGYIYCGLHGPMRRMYRPTRKLTVKELTQLQQGQPLKEY